MIKIIKADERLATLGQNIKVLLLGPAGAGKTTQARTLPADSTLVIDLEAGTLALGNDWKGDVLDVIKIAGEMKRHPWEVARAIAVWVGGPCVSDSDGPYSPAAHERIIKAWGAPETNAHYTTLFVDSITVASRQCFLWCQAQPEARNAQGVPDTRAAYGLLKREMIKWITHLQHCPRTVILACILNQTENELKEKCWTPQVEGAATGMEMPGIFDEVLTIQNFTDEAGAQFRALCCHQQNPWGYPAKDRSGTLLQLEAANLGAVLKKIRAGKRIDAFTAEPTRK